MRFKIMFIKCIFIFSVLSIIQCSNQRLSDKIVVGYLPIIAHLPALVAIENGFFDNLSVEFHVFSNSNDLLSALTNGDIDITTTVAVSPVAQYTNSTRNKDEDNVIRFFSYSKTTKEEPFDAMFVKSNSSIKDLNDLAGKKIALFPGTTAKRICGYFLSKHFDVNVNNITWVGLPPNLQINALLSGDVDALYTYEPIATVARMNQLREIHGSVVASVLNDAPYGGSAINRNFEREDPKLGDAFIKAFDKGILFVRENKVESKKILRKRLGLSEDVSNECNLEYRFTSLEILKPENVTRLQDFIDILADMNEISEKFDVNILIEKNF